MRLARTLDIHSICCGIVAIWMCMLRETHLNTRHCRHIATRRARRARPTSSFALCNSTVPMQKQKHYKIIVVCVIQHANSFRYRYVPMRSIGIGSKNPALARTKSTEDSMTGGVAKRSVSRGALWSGVSTLPMKRLRQMWLRLCPAGAARVESAG